MADKQRKVSESKDTKPITLSVITDYGIIVSPTPTKRGILYAQIEPSGYGKWWRRLLPNVGNWWFEVQLYIDDSMSESWAYVEGGSGGAYTFSGCVRKAMQAVSDLASTDLADSTDVTNPQTAGTTKTYTTSYTFNPPKHSKKSGDST